MDVGLDVSVSEKFDFKYWPVTGMKKNMQLYMIITPDTFNEMGPVIDLKTKVL